MVPSFKSNAENVLIAGGEESGIYIPTDKGVVGGIAGVVSSINDPAPKSSATLEVYVR